MSDPSRETLLQGIENLLAAGNHSTARKLIDQLLVIAPDEPSTLDAATRVACAAGEFAAACAHSAKLRSLRPNEYRGHELAAYVGLASGTCYPSMWSSLPWKSEADRLDFIEKAVHESLRLFPPNPVSLSHLGMLELERQNHAAVIAAADTGLSIDPSYVPLLVVRGRAEFAQDYWQDAQATLSQALQTDPDDAQAHFWLAKVMLARKEHREAMGHVSAAIAKAPHSREWRDLYWEIARHQSPLLRMLLYLEWMLKQLRPCFIPAWIVAMLCFVSGSTFLIVIGATTLLLLIPVAFGDMLIRPLIHATHVATSRRYRGTCGTIFWVVCASAMLSIGLSMAIFSGWSLPAIVVLASMNWLLLCGTLFRIRELRGTWPWFVLIAVCAFAVAAYCRATGRLATGSWVDVLMVVTVMTCTLAPILVWSDKIET